MKTAKSYKLISILTVFVLSICATIFSMTLPANADELVTPNATNYFTGITESTLVFKDDAAVASMESGKTVLIKNNLCVEDFAIKLVVPDGVDLSVNLTYNSYYVNGNKKVDGENVTFNTSIENKVIIKDGSAYMLGLEDAKKAVDIENGEVEVKFTVNDNNFIVATVNGEELEVQTDAYYKIRKIDKAIAKIGYTATFEGDGTKDVKLLSVDQKASDETGAFKQTFVLTSGKLTPAEPVIGLSDDAFTKTSDGYKLCFRDDETETVTPNAYTLLGNYAKVRLTTSDTSNVEVFGDERIRFKAGERTFSVSAKETGGNEKVYATYTVNVQDSDVKDQSAPVYVKDELALEAFYAALEKAYTNGEHFVAIGEKITIPSLADLVYDNLTPYSELKMTVYYKSSTTDTSSSSMEITLNAAGDYVFYVVFEDTDGNSMNKEDFITEEHDKVPEYVEAMRDFVFNFTIKDDAPLNIKAASQGKGYKGSKFTASKFTVDAEGCTVVYKLYYNPSSTAMANSDGWIEIPKFTEVTDENYNQDGYTYDDVKSIGYDGTLTFTPNKTGSYKIVCSATSKHVAGKTASASALIRVEEQATEVVAESWIENNVWTVVFLGVGTVCLIAIVVLLFIKPKDQADEE